MAKILVADDNSNIQKMVGLALKDQGIDVVAVGNGEAAVRKISDLKPDLVLADVFMPVRNGYEVCKYVKDDPGLQHIPVILLVGAFDPLDEQEAQRVGADGVLKKPFVPPDPLISMVKSALARAGVALGNAPVADKTPEPAKRSGAELLTPAAAKLAALREATKPAEAEAETDVENFATRPEQVKIPAGNEPLAFGSLLETPEPEDDAAFIPAKPPTELASGTNDWAKEAEDEEIEEEEEESSGNSWRPGGDLDGNSLPAAEAADVENRVVDWREAAFHGNSPSKPSKSRGWAPAIDEPVHAEAASSVGVTTLEAVKPVEEPAFSGDAWAAAMAAGVEEKAAESQEAVAEAAPAAEAQVSEQSQRKELSSEVAGLPAADNGWYSVTASPWEVEAKKATLLAATWDSGAAEARAADSAVDATAGTAVEAAARHIQEEIREVVQEVVAEPRSEESASTAAQSVEVAGIQEETSAEPAVSSGAENVSGTQAYVGTNVNDTQEIESILPVETKSWESTWVTAPAEAVNQFAETPEQGLAEAEHGVEHVEAPAHETSHRDVVTEPVVEEVAYLPATETAAETAGAREPAANMDEVVARVLARMNPDMLQKMTRELLKPMIEAIVQDELNSKKQ